MCLFCNQPKEILYENKYVYAMYDGFPVSKGHVLIIPKRHCENYFTLSQDEAMAIHETILYLKTLLDGLYHPEGYNIGINNGTAAGQTIFHLHVHLIPRYKGDVKEPRGGVRGVIPDKRSY